MNTKLLLSLIAIFSILYPLSAQNFGGGISVGMNASQIDGDAVNGFNQPGLSLGAFVNYEVGDNIYLQSELLFEQLGSSFQGIVFARTSHLSLPILLKINLPIELGSGSQAIQLHAGPVIGLLVRARNDAGGDLSPNLKSYDTRIVGGLSYRLGPGFSFMLRYGYSLGSFIKTNAPASLNLLAPGKTGLAHNYVNLALRVHFTSN